MIRTVFLWVHGLEIWEKGHTHLTLECVFVCVCVHACMQEREERDSGYICVCVREFVKMDLILHILCTIFVVCFLCASVGYLLKTLHVHLQCVDNFLSNITRPLMTITHVCVCVHWQVLKTKPVSASTKGWTPWPLLIQKRSGIISLVAVKVLTLWVSVALFVAMILQESRWQNGRPATKGLIRARSIHLKYLFVDETAHK